MAAIPWNQAICVSAAAALSAVVVWASFGHRSYVLSGDAMGNFSQHIALGRGYVSANLEAFARRRAGEPAGTAGHVGLRVEGGFPIVLLLARQFSRRAPFLVNAALVPAMLFGMAWALFQTAGRGRRGLVAALLGIALAVMIPGVSGHTWSLALPFRDTLSHACGFGALALAMHASGQPSARRHNGLLLLAGLLIGWSGFSRLAGFLFVIPVSGVVLLSPQPACAKTRLGRLLIVWSGAAFGILLVMAQNLFEGRRFLDVPQSHSLLFAYRLVNPESPVHKGWTPANLPWIAPWLFSSMRAIFPAWMWGLGLAGFLGWGFSAKRRAVRTLPLVGGALALFGFYACYDKVVGRYSYVIVLFVTMCLALGAGWAADVALRLLTRRRPRAYPVLQCAAVVLLAAAAMRAAVASVPDRSSLRDSWTDARCVEAWLRASIPDEAVVLATDPAVGLWLSYFRPAVRRMRLPFRFDGHPDPDSVVLTESPDLFLVSYEEDPDHPLLGWIWDALLNRFELAPYGEPLPLRSRNGGVRFYEILPRQTFTRVVEVEFQGASAPHLYLYLRDWPEAPDGAEVTFTCEADAFSWTVRLREGVNLLTVPPAVSVRPTRIGLRCETPLPSILEARWIGSDPVEVFMSDYYHVASRLSLVDHAEVHWRGHEKWYRDFGAISKRHMSLPQIYFTPGRMRIRRPSLNLDPNQTVVMRLFYSVMAQTDAAAAQCEQMVYRGDGVDEPPLTVYFGNPYADRHFASIHDVMHEVRLPQQPGETSGGWLVADVPGADREDDSVYLFLHKVEYVVKEAEPSPQASSAREADGPSVVRWTSGVLSREKWMPSGIPRVPFPSHPEE